MTEKVANQIAGAMSFSYEAISYQPTNGLRWNAGVLERLWNKKTYRDGQIHLVERHWKPIPTEKERP